MIKIPAPFYFADWAGVPSSCCCRFVARLTLVRTQTIALRSLQRHHQRRDPGCRECGRKAAGIPSILSDPVFDP